MNKFFMGCLSVAALALMIGQAIAESNSAGAVNAAQAAANAQDNGGVVIIETYSASAVTVPSNNNDMQPLPGDPGVDVAPLDSSAAQPVMVEEDMLVEETEDGE
ncbi:MAG: hypothetical protein J6C85_00245 [Alphaproteobacteria bacterium]|nr:hypothetical protein [Alphaproteobacteria bacterium]